MSQRPPHTPMSFPEFMAHAALMFVLGFAGFLAFASALPVPA